MARKGRRATSVAPLDLLLGDETEVLADPSFQLLLVANLMAPLGTALVSPLLSSLTGPFGVSETQVGLLISAYTAPPIVTIPLAGVLADRYGRKPLLVAGLLLFGTAGSAIALTTDFTVALALRFLQGVGFAGLTPMIITSIGDLYRGTTEATAQGVRFTTSGVYQSVFPLVGGALVGIAWQYPFLIYAMAFPIAGAVAWWFPEPAALPAADETGAAPTTGEGDAAADDPAGDGPADPEPDGGASERPDRREQLRQLGRLLAHRRVLAVIVARGLPMFIWIGFLTYNSIVVVGLLGGTPTAAGLLVTVNSVGLAVGASQAGRISAWFDSRLWPLVGANVGLGGGLAVVTLSPSVAVAAVGAAALGVGFGVALSLTRSLTTALAPPSLRGGLVSVAESVGRLTSTVAPVVMGAAVAAAVPLVGFDAAVRLTGVGVGVVFAAGGSLALVVAAVSPLPAVTPEQERAGL